MKTYYIPTSSLNFNNIFSSESISPKGFYYRRNFGYSRWTSIPENPFNGVVLLYCEPKMFMRPHLIPYILIHGIPMSISSLKQTKPPHYQCQIAVWKQKCCDYIAGA